MKIHPYRLLVQHQHVSEMLYDDEPRLPCQNAWKARSPILDALKLRAAKIVELGFLHVRRATVRATVCSSPKGRRA